MPRIHGAGVKSAELSTKKSQACALRFDDEQVQSLLLSEMAQQQIMRFAFRGKVSKLLFFSLSECRNEEKDLRSIPSGLLMIDLKQWTLHVAVVESIFRFHTSGTPKSKVALYPFGMALYIRLQNGSVDVIRTSFSFNYGKLRCGALKVRNNLWSWCFLALK